MTMSDDALDDASDGPVLLEVRDATAWVTLNRPTAANALSCELVGALGHAFARVRWALYIRSVV